MLLLLFSCAEPDDDGSRRVARPGVRDSAITDSALPDSGGPTDTDTTPTDTDTTPTDTDTTPTEPVSTDVCWLGPDRDHTVCAPTFPYSSSWGADYQYPSPYGGSAQYAEPGRFVDLEALDPDLEIAPNFVLSEYMEAYKGQWGILQAHHVEELQDIRDTIGGPLTITSGYRSPGYNAGVGGVEFSRHQYGDASDLDASGWSVEELGAVCDALGADYVGLYEDGHTHCDWRDVPLDPAFYPADRAAPQPVPPVESARLAWADGAWTAPATGFDEGEPLRRWTAWDADGEVLASTLGRRFVPPAGATRLQVVVGGRLIVDGRP